MAKAQAMKPKSSIGDWFRRLTGPKPKPAARPSGSASSTLTNVPAANTATRGGTPKSAPRRRKWRKHPQ